MFVVRRRRLEAESSTITPASVLAVDQPDIGAVVNLWWPVAAGGLTGFIVSSFITGGRHIFSTYTLWIAGTITEATPRRFLPDRFIQWYNDTLIGWGP